MRRTPSAIAAVLLAACGPAAPPPAPATAPVERHVERLPHRAPDAPPEVGAPAIGAAMPLLPPPPCDDQDARVEEVDLNGDGSPDVHKVFRSAGGREWLACKLTDLDFDGKPDIVTLFDQRGARISEHSDVDFDGHIDRSTWFDADSGARTLGGSDSNGDGRIDVLEHFGPAGLNAVERDTDGDGRVDVWEHYRNGILIESGVDRDGDGQPEWGDPPLITP